jgi:hypothetical protein
MLSNPLVLYAVIDFRSYCLMLAAWGVAVATFLASALRSDDLGRADAPLAAVSVIGITLALNLHYVCTLLVGSMLGVFIISQWLARHRRWAILHFAAGVLGTGLFLFNLSRHLPHLAGIAGVLEWSTSALGAVKVAASVLALLLGANVFVIYAALHGKPPSRELHFALTCVAALIVATAVALMMNALHGVILRRYLMPLAPVAAALLGTLAARNFSPRLFAGFLLNALAVASVYLLLDPRRNWDALGARIGKIVASCPRTQVIGVQNWRMLGSKPYPLIDQQKVYALGYKQVGRNHGFRPAMAAGEVTAGDCPVVVWAEHYRAPVPALSDIAARARVKGRLRFVKRSDTGFIAVFSS